MSLKLHAVADSNGRPIQFFISAGQVRDYTGAAALLDSLQKSGWLLADRDYDADWIREAMRRDGITVRIPGQKSRKEAVKYDERRYKHPNRIAIMSGRLKSWRRDAIRSLPGHRLLSDHACRDRSVLAARGNESEP